MKIYKKFNIYGTYAFSELISKALITIITIGSASLLSSEDYAKMGLALSWIGMLYPLFVASADVSIVRYFKEKAANIEFAEMLFQAHFNHVICMSLIMILVMTIYNQFSEIFTFWKPLIVIKRFGCKFV